MSHSKSIPVAPSAAVDLDKGLFRRISLRLLPIIWFCYFLNYLDKTNVAYAKLGMAQQLGFSEAVFGFGASALFIGLIMFEIPSNIVTARIGIRRTLFRIMALWGLCTMAMCLVTTPWMFYTLRFLVGAFEAGFAPGILFYLTLWYPDKRRGQAIAIFYTAASAAKIAAGPLAALIMVNLDGFAQLHGWQWLFILEGLPCVLFGYIAFRLLSDAPEKARWLDATQKHRLSNLLAADPTVGKRHNLSWPGFVELICDYRIWACGLIGFLVLLGTFGLTFWQPTILKGLDLTLTQIGWYSTIPGVLGALASILIARHSDSSGDRCWHFVCAVVTAAVGFYLLMNHATSPTTMVGSLCVTWVGLASAYSLTWVMPPRVLVGKHTATGIALITVIHGAAGIVAPYALGLIKTHTGSFTSALGMLSITCLCAGALCIWFYHTRRIA